jgi:hypothetical protein
MVVLVFVVVLVMDRQVRMGRIIQEATCVQVHKAWFSSSRSYISIRLLLSH